MNSPKHTSGNSVMWKPQRRNGKRPELPGKMECNDELHLKEAESCQSAVPGHCVGFWQKQRQCLVACKQPEMRSQPIWLNYSGLIQSGRGFGLQYTTTIRGEKRIYLQECKTRWKMEEKKRKEGKKERVLSTLLPVTFIQQKWIKFIKNDSIYVHIFI